MAPRRHYGFAKPHLVAVFSLVDGLGSLMVTVSRALRRPNYSSTPRRILLINFAHIGDALMVSPALRAVRAAYPEAHITLLVGPWSKDVLAANPYLDGILVFRPSWWDREAGAYIRPAELRSLVQLLRKGHFDISINFKSFFQENLALWLAGIPTRVGYGIYGGGFFLTHQVEYDWNIHTIEANMALLQRSSLISGDALCAIPPTAIGLREPAVMEAISLSAVGSSKALEESGMIQTREIGTASLDRRNKPDMFVFEEDVQAADAFLRRELGSESVDGALSSRPLVAFHIGAGYPSKLWGEEKYAHLADEIASKWEVRIVVVGGPSDLPLVTRMQQLSGEKLIVAAGQLSIRQTAALISLCQLFVGNDSGPAHIAAAVGTPAIAIFSGENEAAIWRPYANNCVAIQRHPDCSPCGKRACDRDHQCMEEITVAEVFDVADRILKQSSSS